MSGVYLREHFGSQHSPATAVRLADRGSGSPRSKGSERASRYAILHLAYGPTIPCRVGLITTSITCPRTA
eukprot:1193691-Prorocentrum_minimum.AAC.1